MIWPFLGSFTHVMHHCNIGLTLLHDQTSATRACHSQGVQYANATQDGMQIQLVLQLYYTTCHCSLKYAMATGVIIQILACIGDNGATASSQLLALPVCGTKVYHQYCCKKEILFFCTKQFKAPLLVCLWPMLKHCTSEEVATAQARPI